MTFDEYADDYDAHVQSALPKWGVDHARILGAKADHLVAIMERALPGSLCPRILDVGCGTGSMARHLSGSRRRLIGVDPAVRALVRARRECPATDFSAFDGVDIPFADRAFDAVFAASVLHHVNPDRRRRLLEEVKRVTRADGLVMILEHNPRNPLTRRVVSRCEFDRDAILVEADEACDLLRQVGLQRVGRIFTLFTPWRGRLWGWIDAMLRDLPLGGQYIAFGRRSEP